MGVPRMFTNQQRGISFVEMILSLVIISITFTGTLQVFGTLLNWSVYPFIEKQAIAMSQSIFANVQQDQLKRCTSANQKFCFSQSFQDIGEVLPFYQDVTQKHFKMRLTTKHSIIQKRYFQLWELELKHNQGEQFKFSWITRG